MKRQTKFGIVLAAAAVISVSVASLVSARGWVQNAGDWYYVTNDGEYVTETIQSSGNSKFYLNEDGKMVRDYFLEDDNNGNTYYFGSNGAMVTNTWVAIDSANVENQDEYVPDAYWYYFQSSGKAVKGTSEKMKKMTIDGKKYGFNEFGQMTIGWAGENGKTINPDDDDPFKEAWYYAGGDNDGVLRAGWVTYYDGYAGDDTNYADEYTNLYFYFNTSNNKKYGVEGPVYKKINGRNYAFDGNGIMVSGWDVYENLTSLSSLSGKTTYFSGEDDGHQVKKGWVYTVPAESIDSEKFNDDEEEYFYFGSSGDITKDSIKKINGKYYAFNSKGIMKKGVVIWDKTNNKYYSKIDLDYAEGSDIAKKGKLQTGANSYKFLNKNGIGVDDNVEYKLHYFGDDGARRTGSNVIEFTDEGWTFYSNNAGDKGSGKFSKKYYSLGMLLKASADYKYGLYVTASDSTLQPQVDDYEGNVAAGLYIVLNTNGTQVKGNATAKKDGDGNYWMISKSGDSFKGIWTVSVKESNQASFTTKEIPVAWTTFLNADKATIKDGVTQTTITQYMEAFDVITENATETGDDVNLADGKKIVWVPVASGDYTKFRLAGTVAQPKTNTSGSYKLNWFQSDYDGGSNKWIPFGVLDDQGNTVTFDVANATADQKEYWKVPNDDSYFTNCYWKD